MNLQEVAGRTGLVLKKHAPDILLGVGVAGVVGGAVMLAKAARKHDAVKEEIDHQIEEQMTDLDRAESAGGRMDETAYKQAVGRIYIRAGIDWTKHYGPSVGMLVVSIASIVTGHIKTKERLTSAIAAYNIVDRGFKQYRARVIHQYGEEKDEELRYGDSLTREVFDELDENYGKKDKVRDKIRKSVDGVSGYYQVFDGYSNRWRRDGYTNLYFLKTQQAYFNDLLNTRGHVFLNEVWDELGMPRTPEGQLVGWVKDSETGDNVIDLGIFRKLNEGFVNGIDDFCIIDPNVDGVVYDQLF